MQQGRAYSSLVAVDMDSAHKKILTENLEAFCNDLEVEPVLIALVLVASWLFLQFRVDKIRAETVEYNKRRKVVHLVQESGPIAFDLFHGALQRTHQTHLANLLKPDVTVPSVRSLPPALYRSASFRLPGGDARDEVDKDHRNTELHSAILTGDLDEVKSAVNKLHQAKDFAAVNAKNSWAQTPLYLATLQNHVEMMKYLLKNGAQPQLETDDGNNSIHEAVREGHEEALKILIGALWQHDCRDPNVLNAVDNYGMTAMHMAQFGNRWYYMGLLEEAGADINAGDKIYGLTPLHHAVKDAHAQSYIYLLMQSTVDPNKRANNGRTPLHIAADRGNYVAAWLLINAGADPYMQDCVLVEVSDDEEESLERHTAYDYAADNPKMASILDGITFEELWNFLHSAPAENEEDIKACQFLATLLGGGEGGKSARERNAVDQEAAIMLKTLQSQAENQLKVITDYEAREGIACHFRNVLKAMEADSHVDVVMKDPNSI